jgi:hypothetical protein
MLKDENRGSLCGRRVVFNRNGAACASNDIIDRNAIGGELSVSVPGNFDLAARHERLDSDQRLAHASPRFTAGFAGTVG